MNIEINVNNERDILNTYNKNIISESLDNYLLSSLEHKPLKDKLTISIIGSTNADIKNIIKNFYQERYLYLKKIDNIDNYIRLILFIIGVVAILLSEQFSNVISEIFLISGWVVIWEIIYDVLFNEIKRKRKARIYKALANAIIVLKD